MSRPSRFRVGYQTFEIRWLTQDQWRLEPRLSDDDCGSFRQNVGTVFIRAEGYQEDFLRETLLHEVIHACFDVTRANQYVDKCSDPEEFVADTQAPALLAVFTDNPKLTKYLFGG